MALNSTMAQAKREKWERYIGRIETEVMKLLDHRRWNRIFEAVVNANPRLHAGNPMLRHFRSVYGDCAVMTVRRLTKKHPDAFSLSELLEDIAENAEALTLAWTIELYRRPLPSGFQYGAAMATDLATATFKQFAGESGVHFDAAIAREDLLRLTQAADKLVSHADGALAHADKVPPSGVVTFDDIDEAILVIEDVTKRYSLLLTGASFGGGLTPIDTTNALEALSYAWFDPEHPPEFGESSAA